MNLEKKRGALLLILYLALISCTSTSLFIDRGATIAVWDLDDLSPASAAQTSLGDLLSNQVIETLIARGDYAIIEREQLLLALNELQLGTTDLVDERSRLRLGKLLGARAMVFGAYQIIGDMMRLDLRLVEVETGKVIKAIQKMAPKKYIPDWLKAAREAAQELL